MVYTSGLPSCPSRSILRRVYEQDFDGKITIPIGLPTRWSAHVTTMEGHTSEVRGVDYSPDSKRVVTGCQDRTIRLWDAHTGGEILVLKQEHFVMSIAFSPNGKDILAGLSNGKVFVLDAQTGVCLLSQQPNSNTYKSGCVRSVAYSYYQGNYAASAHDGSNTVKLWNMESGEMTLTATLEGHSESINSIAFSRDGSLLVSGSFDRTCKIWTLSDTSQVRTLEQDFAVRAVAISPDCRTVACGGFGRKVALWAVNHSSESDPPMVLEMPGGAEALDFSPDGSSLAVGCNSLSNYGSSILVLCDPITGEWLGESEEITDGRMNHLKFSSDGANIVSCHGKTARTWETAMLQASLPTVSGEPAPTSDTVQMPVRAVTFAFSYHDDDILAVAHEDGTIRLWDVMSSSFKAVFTVPRPKYDSLNLQNVVLTWSSDGSCLALSGWKDFSIDLYHKENNNYSGTVLHGHEGSVKQTSFTSDSQHLISRSFHTVQAWNATTKAWKVIYEVTEKGFINALAVLPGGSDHVLISSSGESPAVVCECREVDDN